MAQVFDDGDSCEFRFRFILVAFFMGKGCKVRECDQI